MCPRPSQVASEDTILYTAQTYSNKLSSISRRLHAKDRLAPLVRCRHLSPFWVSASVLSDNAQNLLLWELKPQIKQLLLLNLGCSTAASLSAEDFSRGVPSAPASWLLPERNIQQISSA
jgi:hypothetical protein